MPHRGSPDSSRLGYNDCRRTPRAMSHLDGWPLAGEAASRFAAMLVLGPRVRDKSLVPVLSLEAQRMRQLGRYAQPLGRSQTMRLAVGARIQQWHSYATVQGEGDRRNQTEKLPNYYGNSI